MVKWFQVFAEKESDKIPWQLCGVNYVVETSHQLGKTTEARKHLRKSSKGTDQDESRCKKKATLSKSVLD